MSRSRSRSPARARDGRHGQQLPFYVLATRPFELRQLAQLFPYRPPVVHTLTEHARQEEPLEARFPQLFHEDKKDSETHFVALNIGVVLVCVCSFVVVRFLFVVLA